MNAAVDRRLLLLSKQDNVVVALVNLKEGDVVHIDGDAVTLRADAPLGFKVARYGLAVGDKVLKYGACIGSVTVAIVRGEVVHVHNMKSDYLPTHA
jgi:altronate dehydratase small subunit